ncbi:MAG: hypothetical protein DWQ05_13250 [Calditrichaeota bacterium]|nr:MAG: hypothetical protein DWQ05_13250 [Calditrichota bacterium]
MRVIFVFLLTLPILFFTPEQSAGQDETLAYKSFKFAGIPILKYDADDGFGYGARLDLYNFSEGGYSPYYYLIELQLFASTGGKREFWLFFDSPHLLKNNQRITGELRYAKSNYAPYFGLGQTADYDENVTDKSHAQFANEDYYTYQRTRKSLRLDYQHKFKLASFLAGFSLNYTTIELNDDPTLLSLQFDESKNESEFTNAIKLGFIFDNRDFEAAPSKGLWSEAIFEIFHKNLGSDYTFSRLTLAHRQYHNFLKNFVFAHRYIYSNTWGDFPFYERQFMSSSYRIEEAGGGAKSIRGVMKNRFIGRQWLLGNLELRFKFYKFQAKNQDFELAIATFYDFGGAWEKEEPVSIKDLHAGRGAGLQMTWNKNFILSIDGAISEEVNLGLYIGLGYLF